MAGKSSYTDEEQAQVYVTLVANEWNQKRTARDTGVPLSTLRGWASKWKSDPPEVDSSVIQDAKDSFLDDAKRIRTKVLASIETKVDLGEGKLSELGTIAGILTDKIDRASGIDQNRRVDHHLHLPTRDELAGVLGPVVQAAITAAQERSEDIIDAELIEEGRVALPAAPSSTE